MPMPLNAGLMLRLCVLATLMILLTACAGTSFRAPGTIVKCPLLIEYPPRFQDQAADILAAMDEDNPVRVLVDDYALHRRACRALTAKP